MKSFSSRKADTKTETDTPFFRKERKSGFFSSSDMPFFSSPTVQRKASLSPDAANTPSVQLSPLSDQAEDTWKTTKDKGKIFDLLRSSFPAAKTDTDLRKCVERLFPPQTDDLWLATTLLDNGPEPLWPGTLLAQRHQLAQQHGWADEPGHIRGTLGMTAGGLSVDSFFFPGKTDNRALIVGGVHGSELSGIQVVEILLERLRTGPRPYYSVIIVPRLFPDNAATAESNPKKIGTKENVGRYTSGTESAKHSTDPNREMPELGKGYESGTKDAKGRDIEPENIMLLELINRYRPARVASIHSTHAPKDAGVYADPRTDSSGKALGYQSDQDLALEMAKAAKGKGANVPGNKLDGKNATGVYPLDKPAVAAGKEQGRTKTEGSSLGGWGSTAICDPAKPALNRPAMRIITVEVQGGKRIEDFEAGKQAARRAELEGHADALREIFLGNNLVETAQDPCDKASPPAPVNEKAK